MQEYNLYLLKAENPEAYKKLAERGLMVGFPVSIKGQHKRPDIGIGYHSTIKFFDPDKDKPEAIHDTAKNLQMVPPDPKTTHIEPGMFKDRMGNDVYVIKLHGDHANQLKENNKKFAHLGFKQSFEYQPHISVDKKTWDHIVSSKAKTAHEAGISFGAAEFRQGHNTLATYRHSAPAAETKVTALPQKQAAPKKLVASERLNKSIDSAVVKETVLMNLEIRSKHPKSLYLSGDFLQNYLQDNPDLKSAVIEKHEERLKHHFGENKELIDLAWEKGIKEAYKLFGKGK